MRLGDLYIQLSARGAEEVKKILGDLEKKADATQASFKDIAKSVLTMGTAVMAAYTKISYDLLRKVGDIQKFAQATGLTTTEVQKLTYASDQLNVSSDVLRNSLSTLSVNLGKAREEGGAASQTLGQLGINLRNDLGTYKTTNDIFYEVVDRLNKMKDSSAKATFANNLFGKGWKELSLIWGLSAEDLKKLEGKIKNLITDEEIEKLEKYEKQLKELKNTFSDLTKDIVLDTLPAIQNILRELGKLYDLYKKFPLLKPFGVDFFRELTAAPEKLDSLIKKTDEMAKAGGGFSYMAQSMGKNLRNLGADYEENKISADKYLDILKDLTTQVEELYKKFKELKPPLEDVNDAILDFVTDWDVVVTKFKTNLEVYIEPAVQESMDRMADATSGSSDTTIRKFKEVRESSNALAMTFSQVLADSINKVGDAFGNFITKTYSSFADFVTAMIAEIMKLVVKLLLLQAIMKATSQGDSTKKGGGGFWGSFLGTLAGVGLRLLTGGFDNPQNDIWAMKQGSDFARNFQQGFSRTFKTPETQPQPVFINVYNATPSTYIEVFRKFPLKDKQRFYEKGILDGQKRYEER